MNELASYCSALGCQRQCPMYCTVDNTVEHRDPDEKPVEFTIDHFNLQKGILPKILFV